MAGAVVFAAPTSALQCVLNEGASKELIDVNESFYFDDGQWTNESNQDAFHSLRHLTTEDDHDQPPNTSITRQQQQMLSDITAPTVHLFPDDVSLDSWRTTYPELWTCEDVLNLIYFIAMQSRDFDLSDFYGEKFQDVDGTQLCSMTEQDFTARDRKYGRLLHGWIKKFLAQSQFEPPNEEEELLLSMSVKREKQDNATPTSIPIPTDIPITVEEVNFDELFGSRFDLDSSVDFRHIQTTPAVKNSTRIPTNSTEQVLTNDVRYQHYQHHTPIPSQLQHQQLHHQSLTHHHHQQQQQQQLPLLPDSAVCPNANQLQYRHSLGECNWPTDALNNNNNNRQKTKGTMRRDGSFSSADGDSSSDGSSGGYTVATASSSNGNPQDEMGSVRAMNGGIKGNHLWEFLCQQLRRSEAVPFKDRLIQWESREDGVFRIMDSKEIAIQWGLFKGNDRMTYEKLSRALRWCRTNGFLATLPKDGKFPKKLCFRFGPKATHWRDFV